ncbi:Reticulocyte-binding protein 2-like a, partial [Durusdinium trenchii]
MSEALKFSWSKKSAGAKPAPPLAAGSGLTIAQEAARNEDPSAGPRTAEEEEKQRKRLEAWKKMQAQQEKKDEKAQESKETTALSEKDQMAQVRAALKEVNQRNRDLGVRKKKKRKKSSSSSSEVLITSTDHADVLITRADASGAAAQR